MRDDNTEPRDNQQIADDNQQAGVADEQIVNRRTDQGLNEEDADEDASLARTRTRTSPPTKTGRMPIDRRRATSSTRRRMRPLSSGSRRARRGARRFLWYENGARLRAVC